MKVEHTRAQIVADIKRLDVRAQKLTEDEISQIMDEGYSEISLHGQIFSNEQVVDMGTYYDANELKLTLDIEEDCLGIYDLYGTIESVVPLHKVYNADAIYQDGRYVGRIHIDLNLCETIDNVVVKYYYTPVSTTDSIYVDGPAYNIMMESYRVALSRRFKDLKAEDRSLARLINKVSLLLPTIDFDNVSRNY